MGATLTTVDAALKEVYGPRIADQVEHETMLVKRIEKTAKGTAEDAGGKYVTFPLKVRRNTGIGYRNELEALQAAGQQGYKSVRVPLRYGYGRVHMSGQSMKLAETNTQAFANMMTEEMEGLKDDIAKDTNRILWGNGLGVLATVDTATVGTNGASVGTNEAALNYLDMDMMIDILDSTGVTPRVVNRKITALTAATGDIIFDGAVATLTIGDIIVRTGNFGREPQGLTSLVSNSTAALFNLSSTTEPLWSSTVDPVNGALSEARMVLMMDTLRRKGGRPTVIWTDLGSRLAYFNLLTSQRRFTGTKDFGGGFAGLEFLYETPVPLMSDVDAPPGKMWFLKEDTFRIYRPNAWAWEDLDGSIWKWVTGFDAYEALMAQYWEFAVDRRNANGVMTGITPGA